MGGGSSRPERKRGSLGEIIAAMIPVRPTLDAGLHGPCRLEPMDSSSSLFALLLTVVLDAPHRPASLAAGGRLVKGDDPMTR